jgi:ubiquinone/menaquinone biosynthesis C-methylase UbiE
MSLGNLYDSIAKYYANIDFFQINSSALLAAMEQLQTAVALTGSGQEVLDLGSGDGKLLMLIHEIYPDAQLVAVDASEDMLKLVKAKLPRISTVQTSITQAEQRFPTHQFDLITASFVCSYVGLPALLAQADYLLKKRGYFLLITTTMDAFPGVQKHVELLGASNNLFKKLLYWWMKKTLQKVKAPQNFDDIKRHAVTKGFEVVQRRQLVTPMVFNNPQEGQEFAEKGGWAISMVDYPWMPVRLLKKIAIKSLDYVSFPFHDQMVVEVVLLKKT